MKNNLKFIAIPLMLIIGLTVFSCKQESSVPLDATFNKAIKARDFEVATKAVYDIMEKQPEEKKWRDTLMHLYFIRGLFEQAITTAKPILVDRPEDQVVHEVIGNSYNRLGQLALAKEHFALLYSKYKSPVYIYEIAELEFKLDNKEASLKAIEELMLLELDEKAMVPLQYSNSTGQNVPIKAAALNVKGSILRDLEKKDEAGKAFEASLELFPEFALAKNNLRVLKEGK